MPRFSTLLAAVLLASACAAGNDGPGSTVLLQPSDTVFQATAPDTFRVAFATSEGPFTVEVYRDWAPQGAQRFYNLVRAGYYDGNHFFRVIPGFMAQFGLHGDPAVNEAWAETSFPDDPVAHSNERGTITFATRGPNTRTTQLFINFSDNAQLDGMGFAPFGRIVEGMPIVDRLHGGYGEGAPAGRGPDQMRIRTEGRDYLAREFPQLDYITSARIVE
jgi:peptidyl-prolyl cis-trans isomerase A (cyclophilin A)